METITFIDDYTKEIIEQAVTSLSINRCVSVPITKHQYNAALYYLKKQCKTKNRYSKFKFKIRHEHNDYLLWRVS